MKIAIIYAFKDSNWFSCTKIVGNLLASYKKAYSSESLKYFDYNFENEYVNTSELASEIISYAPDKIVFLDHRPHPFDLMRDISRKSPKDFSTRFVFHVYGDFTLELRSWLLSSSILKKYKISFYCASDAQVKLIQKTLKDGSTVHKVPFPVNTDEFKVTKAKSNKLRNYFNIPLDAKVFLYTGRFSLTKNTIEMIKAFAAYRDSVKNNENVFLILIGSFDNVGFGYSDFYQHEGEYFRSFDRVPSEIKKNVIISPKLPNKKLIPFYQEADYFLSLSTYHDEDYGMSIAEAGACGCSLVLTDWAGYKSFNAPLKSAVRTKLNKDRPSFKHKEAVQALFDLNFKKNPNEQSKYFKNFHSINFVSEQLLNLDKLDVPIFLGFSKLMLNIVNQKTDKPFYDEMNRELNSFYRELYKSYATEN